MAYFGKQFVLNSQENFEAFVNSFKDEAPEEMRKAIIAHKSSLKLVKNGDEYTMITSQPGGSMKEVTFKSGVEYDEELAGNKAKTTITVVGDTLNQVQKFENKGVTFNITREFSDNQMVATVKSSSWDGTAKRIYKA